MRLFSLSSSARLGLRPLTRGALASLLLAACTSGGDSTPAPAPGAAPTRTAGQARGAEQPAPGDANPEESPFLDGEQRELLQALRKESSGGLSGEVFERAGTLRRIELKVPSADGGSLSEKALAFVLKYGPLWKIKDKGSLAVVAETPAGDCSTVVLQLVHPSGRRVWNALLTVTLNEEGVIRAVAGSLSGQPFDLAKEGKVSAAEAKKRAEAELHERGEPLSLPEPTEIVLDPFFYGNEPHDAQLGWLFAPSELAPGEAPAFVAAVGQTTGSLAFAGPVFTRAAAGSCGGHDPTILPVKVKLDPLTELPTFVDLSPLGGLPVDGQGDLADRAQELLSRESLQRLFGDGAPQVHLQKPVVKPWTAGRTLVSFEEHSRGRRVEGAYLQVVFSPSQRAEAIFARYVYRPITRPQPNVSLATARKTADAFYINVVCEGDPACEAVVAKRLALAPAPAEEVILSSRIFPTAAMPPREERLARRFDYGRHVLFVDAFTPNEGNPGVLLDLPKEFDDIPHDIHNLPANDRLEIKDYVTEPGITPHADASAIRDDLGIIDAFYTRLTLRGFDGQNTRLPVRVQWQAPNAMFCPPPCEDMPEWGLYFGAGFVAPDVTGHEYAHAVTNAMANSNPTGGLAYVGESGALNESYSDLFGNLIFPDADPREWLVAEAAAVGPFRDMKTPGRFGQPGHVGLMDDSCLAGDGCVHTWSGVPNRAAVLFSDGGVVGSAHPGVGRATVAQLYLVTLTNVSQTDQFVQQQAKAAYVCGLWAGQTIDGRPLGLDDCDHLVRSYREVGVDPQVLYGYQKFGTGLFGNRWEADERVGSRLYNGCTLTDHLMTGLDDSGAQLSAGASQSWTIDFGEWGARITSRGADLDPTDRGVHYHLWSNWFQTGVARTVEIIARPPQVPNDDACFYPLPP
nr:M4 family metallopeptidase [Polyangiaceae bacterium]